jgi:hypothetical protein
VDPINTLRDWTKVSTFLATNAMVAASLCATFAYNTYDKCHQVYSLAQ